ncbi:MAG: hypothetical protein HXY24_16100 [Rubrivivax sp.]|nr:hypothetical protein [Rubrivivax sp.]
MAVALRRTPIAFGLPDSIEMPYYHGPIYEDLPASVTVLGRFKALILPGRLGIENPLAASRFADDMAGRPAILSAAGRRGHAILFSPHPEMGDLVRKYLALDGYVRRYLPKRGRRTMEETLAAYRPLDAPAFRLVLNAVHELSWAGGRIRAARRASPFPALARIARAGARQGNRRMPWGQAVASGAMPGGAAEDAEREGIAQRAATGLRRLRKAAADRLARFSPPEQGEYGGVLRRAAEQLESRIGPSAGALRAEMRRLPDTLSPAGYRVCDAWRHLVAAAAASLERRPETPRPAAEELLQAELALSLMDAVRRCLEFDRALGRRERKR